MEEKTTNALFDGFTGKDSFFVSELLRQKALENDCVINTTILHIFKNKKKGFKILFYSSVIDVNHIDVIFFAIIITNSLERFGKGASSASFGMTFAAFYWKMQFCCCPGVGHCEVSNRAQ